MFQKTPILEHKSIRRPRRSEIIILRFLILVAVILVVQFVIWYVDDDHIGQPFLFWMLGVALGYKLLHILYQWYNYIVMTVPTRPELKRNWSVDMLTTYVPGEPKDMLKRTLKAMTQVKYPHTTYLCDEADDPELKELCTELGVVHVYRGKDKADAKAGNINYALHNYARGEIVVILDPDHIPIPEFIDRVLPYFEDARVGFVQCIQAYYNQQESLIARGAAEQTYMFYGPMMLGMQHRGTVQAIGANCTFRRAALDSISGHANGLCEDMHTSMKIHAKHWTSVYVPEMLTRGMTPSSISAYYHQQLKWSRGTFHLLFEVYPKLFRRLNWRQRIHYFLMPLYFLAGVITFIDIGVPIFSLLTYHVPLFIDFTEFVFRILPVLISISLVRHYVQRFILDQHEEGFHFIGGILRVGTWWVYLKGFIYAVLRVHVPYTPTSKADGVNDHWQLSKPNLFVIVLSFSAILFGLHQDFTPYTWAMACFACVNIFLLTFVVGISQQKTIAQTGRYISLEGLSFYRRLWFKFRYLIFYKLLRNSFFSIILILLAFTFSFRNFFGLSPQAHLSDFYPDGHKTLGMSFTGVGKLDLPERKGHSISVYSFNYADPELQEKIAMILDPSDAKDRTPFIKLLVPKEANDGDSLKVGNSKSRFDSLLATFRNFQRPLLLQPIFAGHESDSTIADSYSALKDIMRKEGAGNVSLVWFVNGPSRYRIPEMVDLLLMNDLKSAANDAMTNGAKGHHEKPVLLLGDGEHDPENLRTSPNNNSRGQQVPVLGWITENAYNITTGESDSLIKAEAALQGIHQTENQPVSYVRSVSNLKYGSVISRRATMSDDFQWYVGGNPFYVKGIVYNPEHTWRDGRWPLTRRRLQDDFAKIKSMGANTISREKPTIYDKNILQIAGEMDLKVIYGFYFDPEVDYVKDTMRVGQIKREITLQVKSMKHEKAILAWNIGTATWEQLAEKYHQPYLTDVRLAYSRMIAELAKSLKEIDPQHPVLTSFLGDGDFHAALDDLEIALPYIDAVAVNVSYPDQLRYVRTILEKWRGQMPYLVNGFGPKVNWQTPIFDYDDHGRILEPSSYEKGRLYSKLWKDIEQDERHNLGGLAFCWRDRFDGTATFSGITDAKGRLKPAYFSLKEVWTGEPQTFPLADATLKFETIFSNEAFNMVYNVMSANNLNKNLTYDWFICREEYLERLYTLRVDYSSIGYIKYRIINEFNENITRTLHLPVGEPAVWYYQEKAEPLQRLYLYIYDDEGHVVTASYPIYSDQTHDKIR